MSERVSPTERLRAEIDEVFASGTDLSDALEQVARLGTRLLLQTAIEAEVTVFLGRERYARAALTEDWPRSSAPCRPRCVKGVLFTGPGTSWPRSPKNAQADIRADYWAIFDVPEAVEPGSDAVAFVQARIDAFARRWRDSYPAAVRCLLADRGSLTVYLRFPPIPGLGRARPGLPRLARVHHDAAGLRQLQHLRRQLLEPSPSLQRYSPPGEHTVPARGTAVA